MSSPARPTPAAAANDAPRSLRLLSVMTPPVDPKDRGALLDPAEIAMQVFNGHVSGRWVLDNLPTKLRVKVGRKICFRLRDAQRYLDSLSDQDVKG